eukprot:g9161.t1
MTTISTASDRQEFLASDDVTGNAGVAMLPTINQQGEMPDNHAILAWFSCLCCCWPIGIFAIISSLKVQDRWMNGDTNGAQEASETARKASTVSIVVGLMIWFIFYGRTSLTGP